MSNFLTVLRRCLIAFVLALGTVALGSVAGAQSWQTAASPRPVWVIADGGVYRSLDGAQTWISVSNGLPQGRASFLLAVSESAPQIAYVWGRDGFYRTTDGGQSWTRKMNGLPSPRRATPLNLTIAPRDPQLVYSMWGTAGGLFRSQDGGESWQKLRGRICVPRGYERHIAFAGCESLLTIGSGRPGLRPNVGQTNIEQLVISPRNPRVMYFNLGLPFRSTDGGRTWLPPFSKAWLRRVCPSGPQGRRCPLSDVGLVSLVMDPQHPSVLYGLFGTGLWKTTDAGRTWVRLVKSTPFVVAVDPKRANVVWRIQIAPPAWSVYKSTNGGRTWARKLRRTLYAPPDQEILRLAIDPDSPDTVYVGGFGVLKTSNGGATWARIKDFREAYIDALAVG